MCVPHIVLGMICKVDTVGMGDKPDMVDMLDKVEIVDGMVPTVRILVSPCMLATANLLKGQNQIVLL